MARNFTLPFPSVSLRFWEQSTIYFDSQCTETAEAVNPPGVDTKCLRDFFERIWTYGNKIRTPLISKVWITSVRAPAQRCYWWEGWIRLRLLKRPCRLQLLMYRQFKRWGRPTREQKGGFVFMAAEKISREWVWLDSPSRSERPYCITKRNHSKDCISLKSQPHLVVYWTAPG